MSVKDFTVDEFCKSTTADRLKIDNRLPDEIVPQALATLAMLQRIRDHLSSVAGKDVPVVISSGYRSQALNRAVGGAAASDHLRGFAADIRAPAFGSALDVARELAKNIDELGIGQLINEHPGDGGWVHVSTRKPSKYINRIITISAEGTRVGVVS